jgi:hypothetical protein
MSGMMQSFTRPGVSMRNSDGDESVELGVLEIDQPNVGVLLTGALVPVHLSAVEQLQNLLVDLHQAVARCAQDLLQQLVELTVRQPGLPFFRAVDVPDGLVEHVRQHNIAETGP